MPKHIQLFVLLLALPLVGCSTKNDERAIGLVVVPRMRQSMANIEIIADGEVVKTVYGRFFQQRDEYWKAVIHSNSTDISARYYGPDGYRDLHVTRKAGKAKFTQRNDYIDTRLEEKVEDVYKIECGNIPGMTHLYVDNRGSPSNTIRCGHLEFTIAENAIDSFRFSSPVLRENAMLSVGARKFGRIDLGNVKAGRDTYYLVDVKGDRSYARNRLAYGIAAPAESESLCDGHLHRMSGKVDYFLERPPSKIHMPGPAGQFIRYGLIEIEDNRGPKNFATSNNTVPITHPPTEAASNVFREWHEIASESSSDSVARGQIRLSIDIHHLWHSFATKNEVRKQVHSRITRLLKSFGFEVASNRTPQRHVLGEISVVYGENKGPGYLNTSLRGTNVSARLTFSGPANKKSTWDNLDVEHPAAAVLVMSNGEKKSESQLRNEAANSFLLSLPPFHLVDSDNPMLTTKWTHKINGAEGISSSDDVIVVTGRHSIWGLSEEDGRVLWKTPLTYSQDVPKPIVTAGYVVVGGTNHYTDPDRGIFETTSGVTAYDKNGRRIWRRNCDGDSPHQIVLTEFGIVVATSQHGRPRFVFCLDPASGAIRWKKEMAREVVSRPVVHGSDIVFPSRVGVSILNGIDGSTKTTGKVFSELAQIGEQNGSTNASHISNPDDRTLIAAFGEHLLALDINNDRTVWGFASKGNALFGPPLHHNGMVLIGSNNGSFYAFDQSNGKGIWRKKVGVAWASPSYAIDDSIYVASKNMLLSFDMGKGEVDGFVDFGTRCSSVVGNGNEVLCTAGGIVYALEKTDRQTFPTTKKWVNGRLLHGEKTHPNTPSSDDVRPERNSSHDSDGTAEGEDVAIALTSKYKIRTWKSRNSKNSLRGHLIGLGKDSVLIEDSRGNKRRFESSDFSDKDRRYIEYVRKKENAKANRQ